MSASLFVATLLYDPVTLKYGPKIYYDYTMGTLKTYMPFLDDKTKQKIAEQVGTYFEDFQSNFRRVTADLSGLDPLDQYAFWDKHGVNVASKPDINDFYSLAKPQKIMKMDLPYLSSQNLGAHAIMIK